nr:RNA-directed DNA polymerase, eukaryota, reverse transcriptase zinc-binding domain protein [Tanacetum cinerariifolium]
VNFLRRLNSDQVFDLEDMISNKEIKRVVWDCGSDKSSGPDGFTFEFFKKFWTIVSGDVTNAIKEFFISSSFPKGCNSLFIALIPKVMDAKHLKDFRPISLISYQYKIIGKILANRLSLVIGDIVSQEQSAFIKGIQIIDDPLILNEVISWRKARKEQLLMFKVDFQKAFDSVRWDNLNDILGNSPTDEFSFHRGLQQGDPISPFPFILVMESLHVSFQRLIDRVNVHKSSIYGVGVRQADVQHMAENFGCISNNLPFTYLGVKVGANMMRLNSWSDVVKKVSNKLSNWKAKTLFVGGRLTLLKSILGTIPAYYMSLFKAPEDLAQLIGRRWNIHIPIFDDPSSWDSWLNGMNLSSMQRRILETTFISMWWHIWKFRNLTLFSSKKPRKDMIFDDIVSHTYFWLSNRCRSFNVSMDVWLNDPLNAL